MTDLLLENIGLVYWSIVGPFFSKKDRSLISGRRGCAEFFGNRKDAACEQSRPMKPCCGTPDLCASATGSSPQTLIIFTVAARRLFAQLFYSGFYCNEANYPIAMLLPRKSTICQAGCSEVHFTPCRCSEKKKKFFIALNVNLKLKMQPSRCCGFDRRPR